jgi:hypothetical protein
VASLLVDSPPAQPNEQKPADGPPGAPAGSAAQPVERSCAKCGAPMAPGQDWCLQCGAGAPGSLGGSSPVWRSTTAILGATAILILGAAVAAYAALNKTTHKPRTVTTTVAQVTAPPPVTGTPSTPVTPPRNLGSTGTPAKPSLPLGTVKPPKIPLTAVTPKSSGIKTSAPTVSPTVNTTPTTTTPSTPASGGTTPSEESQPAALLLDTNAASTYNPYNYPASNFGDPSLAIDGDSTTGWTALVDPATAPKMAEGLLIDLKSPQKLSAVVLDTSTPGMTVQVYGANAHTVPTSITDPAWVPLSHSLTDKKKHLRIKLRNSSKAFTFLTLWISRAPAASIGTEQAPGHVNINELELFPAS